MGGIVNPVFGGEEGLIFGIMVVSLVYLFGLLGLLVNSIWKYLVKSVKKLRQKIAFR